MAERERIKQILLKIEQMIIKLDQYEVEIIQLREECKARETCEHNLRELITSFTHSSKIIDKIVRMQKPLEDKTGLGFDSTSSLADKNLTKQSHPLNDKAKNTIKFVKCQDNAPMHGLGCKSST